MKDYVRRVLAKDTLRIAVVGDVEPVTLGKMLDQTFGGLPAKASLTPVADIEARSPRGASLFRSTCADRGDVRRPRHQAPRSEFHGRLCREPTFSAAEDCRRGFITKSARSAVSPIRSLNRCCGLDSY